MRFLNPPITEAILDITVNLHDNFNHEELLKFHENISDLDIAEFENRIEDIRDELLEGHLALSKGDVNILKQRVGNLSVFQLLAVARLLSPLLENEVYSQDAASIINVLLQHPADEVRYAALEAISYALGEVPIAEEILAEAKNLLKNEESTFVREFLESL